MSRQLDNFFAEAPVEEPADNLRRRAREEEERGRKAIERGDDASARLHYGSAIMMIVIVAGMVAGVVTVANGAEPFQWGGSDR